LHGCASDCEQVTPWRQEIGLQLKAKPLSAKSKSSPWNVTMNGAGSIPHLSFNKVFLPEKLDELGRFRVRNTCQFFLQE
jgi:hypothetical protein